MKASQFFHDLHTSYESEIEDHSYDSEGNDVLRARLKEKRSQFDELVPMIEFAPEMVAIAFHRGLSFSDHHLLDRLVQKEPDDFPSWGEIAQAIDFQPWARDLADRVLEEEGGEQFLLLCAGLEYLHGKNTALTPAGAEDEGQEESAERNDFEENDEEGELGSDEAGADWLADQGFDRHE